MRRPVHTQVCETQLVLCNSAGMVGMYILQGFKRSAQDMGTHPQPANDRLYAAVPWWERQHTYDLISS